MIHLFYRSYFFVNNLLKLKILKLQIGFFYVLVSLYLNFRTHLNIININQFLNLNLCREKETSDF